MFAEGVRTSGFKVIAQHRIKEGVELGAWYVRHQNMHGSPGRTPEILDTLLMYGPDAKAAIPELEEHIKFFEGRRNRGEARPDDIANQIRAAIEKIKAMEEKPQGEMKSIADRINEQKKGK
jgi:hypothetical protein